VCKAQHPPVHDTHSVVACTVCCLLLHRHRLRLLLQKVVYTFTPIGLAMGALGLAWMVLVP
jgi:hypothetical protein